MLSALAVGENVGVRAPFVAVFFATGWAYYRLTSGLFDPQTALVALFALNVTPFFFASALATAIKLQCENAALLQTLTEHKGRSQ